MAAFDSYKDAYPNAHLTRSDTGVLEIAFHTFGEKLSWLDSSTTSPARQPSSATRR
jgi:hypothetical protein